MRTHPGQRIRVSRQEGEIPYIGVFVRGQDSKGEPDHYLSLATCKELKRRGLGEFINRKSAFRRFDVSVPQDQKTYIASSRRGESAMIDEAMMNRYVAGDVVAIEAVNAWS